MIRDLIRSNENQINFWPGFVDIITFTLFTSLMIFFVSFIRYQYLDYLVGKGEEDIKSIMELFNESEFKVANGRIIIQESILFDLDSDSLKAEGRIKLLEIGKRLKGYLDDLNRKEKFSLIIEGHTDRKGKDDYNLYLSFKRAKAVADYWEAKILFSNRLDKKIDIIPAGYGETRMLVPTEDNIEKRENRRIEIRIVPKFNKMLEGWLSE